jgi:hypothetical protein
MTLFVGSMLLMLCSSATAVALSYRLKASQPELHRALQIFPWSSTPQFWVYHFLVPSKLRSLTFVDQSLALASIALLSLGLAGLLGCVLAFARGGNL